MISRFKGIIRFLDQGTKRHRTNSKNKETTANLREKREWKKQR